MRTLGNMAAVKVQQAISLLDEFDLALWIVQFARESYDHPQPIGELAVGTSVTWPAAFIVTAEGESTAIVATLDADNVRSVGAYDNVVGYVKDIGPAILQLLNRVDPSSIGVSYSEGDESADNITHGMYLSLLRILDGTPFASRLRSAEAAASALRSRKTPDEVQRIRDSIDLTLELFEEIEMRLSPGITERQLFEHVGDLLRRRGLQTAWDRRYDPTVSFGPLSTFGHAGPGNIALEPGMLVHIDLGVKNNGYCSDLQRTWYLVRNDEVQPPDDVQAAFDAVRGAIGAGFASVRPGVAGYEVDAAARAVLQRAGYDEPPFALGHQLGQSTHDAGGLLGPQWPRYGNRPNVLVEKDNVFTLEFALRTSAGTIGLEEDVVVTTHGAEYLAPPQTELVCLRR